MKYKLPRSVQVVLVARESDQTQYLLLRRIASLGGFWQSITGSLEEGETHREAALREVKEETGYDLADDQLIDLDLINRFEISPLWRKKYAPGVTRNEEVCFWARVSKREVAFDELEHDAFAWVSYDEAMRLLFWESNKRALEKVHEQAE